MGFSHELENYYKCTGNINRIIFLAVGFRHINKILETSIELYLLSNGFPAGVAEAHLDGALGADGVAAVEDDGLLSIQTNGARFLLVELLALHLQAAQFRLNPLHFVLLYGPRFSFVVCDHVDFFVDDFSAFTLLPPGAAVGARVLMAARQELNVSGEIFAETASLQLRP